MASIQRIVSSLTNKTSYRVQVRLRGHAPQSATFRNRKEAQAWATSIEAAIREARYFPHAAARRTRFEDFVQDYIRTVLADSKPKQRAARIRHLMWWAGQFRGLSLADITTDRISQACDAFAGETFIRGKPRADRKTGLVTLPRQYRRAAGTINRCLGSLSHALSFAVKERRLLERNPVVDIRKRKEPRGRTRFLSDAEREALLRACAASNWPPLHTLVLLAISTGARRAELIGLKWCDIDLKSGRALVRHTKNEEPKVLPLVGRTLHELRLMKLHDSARSEWVFPRLDGDSGAYLHFNLHWYRALRVARLEDFRFHDLRHTCASYLASQGASLLQIADVLGHKTLAMVKRYSHLTQDHKGLVIGRMAKQRGL